LHGRAYDPGESLSERLQNGRGLRVAGHDHSEHGYPYNCHQDGQHRVSKVTHVTPPLFRLL
jgi:hypothetical protein